MARKKKSRGEMMREQTVIARAKATQIWSSLSTAFIVLVLFVFYKAIDSEVGSFISNNSTTIIISSVILIVMLSYFGIYRPSKVFKNLAKRYVR